MTTLRWFAAALLAATLSAPTSRAQEPPKPGPEHDVLKKNVGSWDCTVKMMGTETKGTSTNKMDLGGLWLSSAFDGEIAGMKFSGRGMDTYDAGKKKYVAVWCDSMSTHPLHMEGTYDATKKTMTMVGEGPGPDGKMVKHTMKSVWKDDDTMEFGMYMGDVKEPILQIIYKRKK